jgi:molybdenum cofactor cytidylyltransferase
MLKSSAVILAAGASRRLGYNKLCIRVNGETVIRKTVRFFVEAEIGEVAVVTGFERERVERELADLPVSFFHNERHEDGMSASIKAALPIISRSDRVFFHLGDKPFVEGDIIARVIGAYEAGQYSVIVPVHGGTKGHPVLVDMTRHLEAIRSIRGEGGLRDFIEAHRPDVHFLEAGIGTTLDLDTEDDVESLRRRGYTIEKD